MILIGGVEFRESQILSFDSRSPDKEQTRSRSIAGNIEDVTLSYTHNYNLKLQSLDREKYTELYRKLIELDATANGKITIEIKGEIYNGIVHLAEAEIPATLEFDFDMTSLSPTVQQWINITLPLSIYVKV